MYHYSVSFNVNIEKYTRKKILKYNNFDFNSYLLFLFGGVLSIHTGT